MFQCRWYFFSIRIIWSPRCFISNSIDIMIQRFYSVQSLREMKPVDNCLTQCPRRPDIGNENGSISVFFLVDSSSKISNLKLSLVGCILTDRRSGWKINPFSLIIFVDVKLPIIHNKPLRHLLCLTTGPVSVGYLKFWWRYTCASMGIKTRATRTPNTQVPNTHSSKWSRAITKHVIVVQFVDTANSGCFRLLATLHLLIQISSRKLKYLW